MVTERARHLFSLEQYERMGSTGVLGKDDRVEFISGEVIELSPPDPSHSTAVYRLARAFFGLLGDRAVVRIQDTLWMPPDSAPQPDLVLVCPPDTRYVTRHPEPDDVELVVEVARTSLRFDTDVKVPLYARHGVGELWVVDIAGRTIRRHLEPSPDGYLRVDDVADVVRPAAFPDVAVAVDELLVL